MSVCRHLITVWALGLSFLVVAQGGDVPVPDTPDLVPITATDITPEITALQERLQREFAEGSFADAAGTAQRLLEQARQFGPDHAVTLTALTNLAVAWHRAGELERSMASYLDAVTRIETTGHFRDPRLAQPLFGLGTLLYEAGQFVAATDALERAAFIVRAHNGLESLEQLAYDNTLMLSLIAVGRLKDAANRQEMRLGIIEKVSGETPELAAALAESARWYRLLGRYDEDYYRDENRAQRRRVAILEALDTDPNELASAYRDLCGSYQNLLIPDLDVLRDELEARRRPSFSATATRRYTLSLPGGYELDRQRQNLLERERLAESALLRALSLQRESGKVSRVEEAKTLVMLGDHHLMLDKRRAAARRYREAWQLLRDGGEEEAIKRFFGEPVAAYVPRVPLPEIAQPDNLWDTSAEVDLALDVNRYGRVKDVELIDMRPVSVAEFEGRIRRYAREMRFRPPQGEDGPIETEDFRYTMTLYPRVRG